ncbi:MAG TPA: DUF664 domain-containing protein [Jatrophihabitans sp.]|jgi:uncharacterized damage-inducible protein DinB|uniref:mycothiol transferase n=1 Tax=Jatrophihabitans sp. TaxID=1932789 RepID=UPI002E0CD3C7|nr:DUF664 domain-containing protein [Jatrophihabitans sp.]
MSNALTLISDPPISGSEIATLAGGLDRIRRTFAYKCADLDAAAMGRRIGASAVTLGGLVRHLARVEAHTLAWKLHDRGGTGAEADWDADWDWTGDEDVAAVWRDWFAAVERSQRLVAEADADGGPGRTRGHEFPGWGTPSLRRLLVDMIDEYARHTGHADLIRESIDGRVGEDAPGDWTLPRF